jgi:Replicase family/Primase C terminal 1 (PriCT-1)
VPCDLPVWDALGLRPNLAVVSPTNGHAHLEYWLDRTIRRDPNPTQKVERFFCDIAARLTHAIGGDSSYGQRNWTKNPLSPVWQVHYWSDQLFTLDQFADLLPANTNLRTRVAEGEEGRNCRLFDSLRRWAYANLKRYQHAPYTVWHSEVLHQAEAFNDTIGCQHSLGSMGQREVASVAKSVSSWVWDRYTGQGRKNRGAMNLDASLSLQERQTLGAAYTHSRRTLSTLNRISLTRRQLPTGTQVEIANQTGLSLRTIKTHWTATGRQV